MRTHKPVKKERIHNAAINMLECSKSGVIVTGSADKTIKTFDTVIDKFKKQINYDEDKSEKSVIEEQMSNILWLLDIFYL